MGYDFREREIGSFDIEVAFDDLKVGRYATQELEGFFVGDVAEAEYLTDFTGCEELLELYPSLI